jgi:dipeptidyl aminopeptidase/acylaminoacyl peptidase
MQISRTLFLAMVASCRPSDTKPALPDPSTPAATSSVSAAAPSLTGSASTPPPSPSAPPLSQMFEGASSVEEVGGEIVAKLATGPIRITSGESDREPALSPDGRRIAFVRLRRDGVCLVPTAESAADCLDLWIVESGKAPRRLLAGEKPFSIRPAYARAAVSRPWFSRDGMTIYFDTNDSSPAPGGQGRAYNLASGKEIIFEGAVHHEILTGPYAGQLVIEGTGIKWDPVTKESLGRKSWHRLASKAGVSGIYLPEDEAKRKAFLKE